MIHDQVSRRALTESSEIRLDLYKVTYSVLTLIQKCLQNISCHILRPFLNEHRHGLTLLPFISFIMIGRNSSFEAKVCDTGLVISRVIPYLGRSSTHFGLFALSTFFISNHTVCKLLLIYFAITQLLQYIKWQITGFK